MSRAMRAIGVVPAAAVALAAMATGVMGQESSTPSEVQIQASKVVVLRHGYSHTGIQNETVQLTQKVSYADLDLATPSGAAELENRVHDTATAICKQLGVLYPAGSWKNEKVDRTACIKGAVESAMVQARVAIAAATEPTRR